MDSFITTFHIDWKIIIAQAINFTIVFIVFYLLAYKPLRTLMAEREEKITGGINDAKKNAEILKNTQKEYDEIISKARAEAHTIFQEGKAEAEENKKIILDQATRDVEKMIENGKKRLESEKEKMLEDAKKEIVSLVVRSTEKLLESQAHDNVLNKKK